MKNVAAKSRPRIYGLIALAMVFCGVFLDGKAHALAEAGTQIKSQVTAIYSDTTGNTYTLQSNIAFVEVQQVYSGYHQGDAHKFGLPGSAVSFPYIVANTGNGTDTYTTSLAGEWGSSDNVDFSAITIHQDVNANGVADAGEEGVIAPADIGFELDAGETKHFVVVAVLPNGTEGHKAGMSVTVTSSNGTVSDNSRSVGVLTKEGRDVNFTAQLNFMATITNTAILDLSQTAVADHENDQITFTTTVSNVGGQAARDVVIFNGTPWTRNVARNAMIEISQQGVGFGTAIDPSDTDLTLLDNSGQFLAEGALGDMNGDGDTTDSVFANLRLDLNGLNGSYTGWGVPGIWGVDDTLAPGASVSISFTVQYVEGVVDDLIPTITAGTIIANTAFASGDLDGDGGRDGYSASNKTLTEIPYEYKASIFDLGTGSAPDVNDGGDDTGTVDNIHRISGFYAGETLLVEFDAVNNGNGEDTIEVFGQTRFSHVPASAVYTIKDRNSGVPIIDTNDVFGADTGPLAAGEARELILEVSFPHGVTAADFDLVARHGLFNSAFIIGSSASNPDGLNTAATVETVIGQDLNGNSVPDHVDPDQFFIWLEFYDPVDPTIDLSISAADNDSAVDNDPYVAGVANTIFDAATVSGTYVTDLYLQNDLPHDSVFNLSAYSTDMQAPLYEAWQVRFLDMSGQEITQTSLIGPGASYQFQAEIILSSDGHFALADSGLLDLNTDSDGDYPVYIQVENSLHNQSDTVLIGVDVGAAVEYVFSPSQSINARAGGVVDIARKIYLNPEGSTTTGSLDYFQISQSLTGWYGTVMVDTDGDRLADSNFNLLETGADVWLTDRDGNFAPVTLVAVSGGTEGQLIFPIGGEMDILYRVAVPTSASAQQTNEVSMALNSDSDWITDFITVNSTNVRLTKYAAVLAGCGSTRTVQADGNVFSAELGEVASGDCVEWLIVATNEGLSSVNKLRVIGVIPPFSTFQDTVSACYGNFGVSAPFGCNPTILTSAIGDDECDFDGGQVYCDFRQEGGTPILPSGVLPPGETVSVMYLTAVD